MSVDGFIAGPDNDLGWLHRDGVTDTFTPFLGTVGAMLMGRNTHDIVAAMEHPWVYGEIPVLVATRSPETLIPGAPTVRAVTGSIAGLIEEAAAAAAAAGDDKCVYLDGGALVRSALDAELVDELILTVVPVVLGGGVSLFTGVTGRTELALVGSREIGGGLVELRYKVQAAAVGPTP
jgi:dihydrofolate reductase